MVLVGLHEPPLSSFKVVPLIGLSCKGWVFEIYRLGLAHRGKVLASRSRWFSLPSIFESFNCLVCVKIVEEGSSKINRLGLVLRGKVLASRDLWFSLPIYCVFSIHCLCLYSLFCSSILSLISLLFLF